MLYGQGAYRYELVEGWAKLPAGESFLDVGGVCIDAEDRVYVLSRGSGPVTVFERDGQVVARWGQGHFRRAHGSRLGPDGSLYCTDDRNHTVVKFGREGDLLMTLGTKDQPSDTGYRDVPDLFERIASIVRGAGPFNRPTGVALSLSGEIFVADGYGNARVHRFTAQGEPVGSWGEPGPGPCQFRLPHNLWIDPQDRVWVADRENHRLQVLREDGTFIAQWTDLLRPTDVCIDADGVVYVPELCKRMSIFAPEGRLLSRWGNEGRAGGDPLFVAPHAVAVDSRGDLYIGEVPVAYAGLDRGARALQKFARIG